MKWWETKSKEDGTEEVALPKVIQDQLDEAKGLKTKIEGLESKLSGLDSISTSLAAIQEQLKPKPKPAAKTPEQEQEEREEISALLLTDPEAAYARLSSRTNAGVMQLAAQNARREVFQDQAQEYPYYTGTMKTEIDSILGQQPLHMQANVDLIRNTYHTVLGRHITEIQEGKIKDRFASSISSSRNTGPDDKEENDRIYTKMTDDIARAARHAGMEPEKYLEFLNSYKEEAFEI